jgi:tRNA modification GTPase
VAGCQLLLLVLDGSKPLPKDVLDVARLVPRERVVCVVNKADLAPAISREVHPAREIAWETVWTSALTGEGIDELAHALWRTVAQGGLDASAADCLFNARQRTALREACSELAEAESAVAASLGYEFAAVNLLAASDALGRVTGQISAQDVLDGIFGRFCIGK